MQLAKLSNNVIKKTLIKKPALRLGSQSGAAPGAEHPQEQAWSCWELQKKVADD